MDKTTEKYKVCLIYVVLAVGTLAVYQHVRNCDFVKYDDDGYVTRNYHINQGLTGETIRWAFFEDHIGNWHPLTTLSHLLDYELFGLNARWHHLTSLLFHLASTLLMFAVFKRMTGAVWRSAFVAVAFALHPVHVESVAWVAERKDVLSMFFWLLTMWAYTSYVRRGGIGRYAVVLACLAMGLMSKPMVVTLPFILLLLDWWPLGRFENCSARRLVLEKVPLFILTGLSCVITFLVERGGGTVAAVSIFSPKMRIANALISYVKYIGKMFWPINLSVFYVHPGDDVSIPHAAVCAVLLVVITAVVIWQCKRWRYVAAGWLWYVVSLLPVIGLVQVGDQALADRYTYIPYTGLFIIVAWGGADILAGVRYRKIILGITMSVVISALAIGTHFQVRHWSNSLSLFEHAVKVSEECYITRNGLGIALLDEGRLEEAGVQFRRILKFEPHNPRAHNNYGIVLVRQNRVDEAVSQFTEALKIEPGYADPYRNIANTFLMQNKLESAAGYYRKYLELDPFNAHVHDALGRILVVQDRPDEAIKYFIEALRIKPDFAEAEKNLEYARNQLKKR